MLCNDDVLLPIFLYRNLSLYTGEDSAAQRAISLFFRHQQQQQQCVVCVYRQIYMQRQKPTNSLCTLLFYHLFLVLIKMLYVQASSLCAIRLRSFFLAFCILFILS